MPVSSNQDRPQVTIAADTRMTVNVTKAHGVQLAPIARTVLALRAQVQTTVAVAPTPLTHAATRTTTNVTSPATVRRTDTYDCSQ